MRRDLWLYLVVAALGLTLVEWWTCGRRITIGSGRSGGARPPAGPPSRAESLEGRKIMETLSAMRALFDRETPHGDGLAPDLLSNVASHATHAHAPARGTSNSHR
ncbi:MAG TPA: hypothetical protein VGQ83_30495 [Polyangia bacterium]